MAGYVQTGGLMMLKNVVLLGLVCLLGACGDNTPVATQEQAIAVSVARVEGASTSSVVTGTGSLLHEREIVLSFRVPGVVRQLTVDNGSVVQRGQRIAGLDTTQLDARAGQAQADYTKAMRDYDRDKQLAADGWVSGQRVADRQTSTQTTKAALDSANFDRRWGSLVSPASGVVLVRHIQSGEVVAAGQPVVTLTDGASPLVVRVSLADKDVARIRMGDPAWVTVSALPGLRLAGSISRIDQRVDARTGATDVDVRVPNAAGLKTGFVANVGITARTSDAATTTGTRLPAEAIVEASGNTATVFVVDEKTKRAKQMRIGFLGFDGDDAKVSGLTAGQSVITSGGALVKEGSLLLVVAAAE
jgi:RND family efflux transporter MFP subunit